MVNMRNVLDRNL